MTNPLKGVTFPGLPGEFQIPQNAEDVGARPDTWMPTAEEVGALPTAFSGTVSDAWVNNKTYYVGDYCIHSNTLWRCKVQHSGVTPTVGAYWMAADIGVELAKRCSKVEFNDCTVTTLTEFLSWLSQTLSGTSQTSDNVFAFAGKWASNYYYNGMCYRTNSTTLQCFFQTGNNEIYSMTYSAGTYRYVFKATMTKII